MFLPRTPIKAGQGCASKNQGAIKMKIKVGSRWIKPAQGESRCFYFLPGAGEVPACFNCLSRDPPKKIGSLHPPTGGFLRYLRCLLFRRPDCLPTDRG
jgi:hypothetical protein